MGEIELTIPPRLDFLAVARLVVATAATLDPPLSEARLDDLRLAVSEACSNAIKAHGAEAADEPVRIVCELTEQAMTIAITDRGPGFDPDKARSMPASDDPDRLDRESGLGIPLIRVLTDHVRFDATPEGTTVTMVLERGPGSTPED